MYRFPIDSGINAVGVSVKGKIKVVYGIVFFFPIVWIPDACLCYSCGS